LSRNAEDDASLQPDGDSLVPPTENDESVTIVSEPENELDFQL